MKDARRRPRDVVDQYLPVSNRETGELVGYLTDVNVDGGMLQSEHPIEEGLSVPLRMELDRQIKGSRYIDVDAQSKWCRKDRNAVFHRIGFQFVDPSPEVREQIAELAERYRLIDAG